MQDLSRKSLPTLTGIKAEIQRRLTAGVNADEVKVLTQALEKIGDQQIIQHSKFLNMPPVEFARRILGRPMWDMQARILQSVQDNARTAVRSCHGIGKTYTAATAILWFLYTKPKSIILSTAPTWRQVEKLIWKEIRAAHRKALVPLGGNLLPKDAQLELINSEWYAAGISTNQPDRFQGFHEEHIMIVVDEAAGVSEEIFEAIEGVLTSSGARLLLLGNPTAIGTTFYNAFKSPAYAKFHISAFDTPNFTQFGITLDDIANDTYKQKIDDADLVNPRLITPDWVRGRYLEWGTESPVWYSRILGEFPKQGDDTLIPLHWIALAMERWRDSRAYKNPHVQIGVDVAAFGSDRTVIVVRRGIRVERIDVYSKQSTMETAGLVKIAREQYHPDTICVDTIGVGQGVVDALAEQGIKDTGVNVAQASSDPEQWANLRAELWCNLRDRLNPDSDDPIALPPDDSLLSELSSVKYKFTHKGALQIEEKSEMKKRLGRSPDIADAVVLAFARPKESFVYFGGETVSAHLFD